MDYEKIGNFLYELRKSRNLTQKDLSKRFYISREAISKWERGISLPDYPSLIILSRFYNITINEILAGEKIDEHNRDRIEAVALTILQSSEKKIKKSKIINVCIFLIALLIILVFYFINNYNSIHMYTVYGSNNEYYFNSGELFIHRDRTYLKLGSIYKSDGSIITNDDGYSMSVYYNRDRKYELMTSDNVENLNINLDNHKNFINEVGMKNLLDNIYVDIIDDKNISTIKIKKNLFYSNDINSVYLDNDDQSYLEILGDGSRTNSTNTYEICGKEYKYKVDDSSITFNDYSGNKIIYCKNFYQIDIIINEDVVSYSYDLNSCLSDNCEKYLDIIKWIEKDREKVNGLS